MPDGAPPPVHPDVARTIAALAKRQSRLPEDEFVARSLAIAPRRRDATDRALARAPSVALQPQPFAASATPFIVPIANALHMVAPPPRDATAQLTPRDAIALFACGTSFLLALATVLAQIARMPLLFEFERD